MIGRLLALRRPRATDTEVAARAEAARADILAAGGHVSACEPLFIESVTRELIGEVMRMLQRRTGVRGGSL